MTDHLSARTRRRLSRSPFAPPPDQLELPLAKLPIRVLADAGKRRPPGPVITRYVCPNCGGPHPRADCRT